MAYRSVVIIGLGTLGGFVTEAISNLDSVEKIVIIDHDIVEQKNLRNSIYRQIDIGSPKVEALKDILTQRNKELEVWAFQTKYVEGVTKLTREDLVIDCRDYTYDRESEIDARFYISSRYLMADFRKNVTYKERHVGKYITELTKSDLRHAASIVSMLVGSNTITHLIKSQSVQKYELDYVKHIDECNYDVVYEGIVEEEKFVNLSEKIVPILDMNKKKDVTIYLGDRTYPLAEKVIPTNKLKDGRDVVLNLASVVSCQSDFNNFVVSVFNEGSNVYIELIPETGAA